MAALGYDNIITDDTGLIQGMENAKTLKQFPPYGSMNGNSTGDTCPTCRGIGRIPEAMKTSLWQSYHVMMKLHVCVSMTVCLFFCFLILFFLFPRRISLTPTSVLSVMVYFTPDTVDMEVTNLINITNENFVPVHIKEFTVQSLVTDTVVSKTTISNMTAIQPRSKKSYTIHMSLPIKDKGLNNYCRSSSIKIHMLFVELQMTLTISYLSHTEQLSLNTFEYIDCGANSTIPHSMRR